MNDVDGIYRSSIKWLAYTPLASMSFESRSILVHDILRSALLSQEVYSFANLLTPEIHAIAEQGHFEWLFELLSIVNKGHMDQWLDAKEHYTQLMRNDVDLSTLSLTDRGVSAGN